MGDLMTTSLDPRRPDPVDQHVGRRLRARRLVGGISQAQLARTIGVTYQQVQKYECGTNRISVSKLYRISEALGAPVTFFFEGLDEQDIDGGCAKAPIRDTFFALAGGTALVEAFVAIRPAIRRRIIALLQEMASDMAPETETLASPAREEIAFHA